MNGLAEKMWANVLYEKNCKNCGVHSIHWTQSDRFKVQCVAMEMESCIIVQKGRALRTPCGPHVEET